MRLHTFRDGTAILKGLDASHILTDRSGTLYIGQEQLRVNEAISVELPPIDGTEVYVKFIDTDNTVFIAGGYRVKNGYIIPDSRHTDGEIRLMHRLDLAEETAEALTERVKALEEKYSDDTLGFLINNTD